MKKVAVMIVDTKTSVSQFGVIEEPVKEGFEVENALKHFGVDRGNVLWDTTGIIKTGFVEGTTKVVSVVCPQNVYILMIH